MLAAFVAALLCVVAADPAITWDNVPPSSFPDVLSIRGGKTAKAKAIAAAQQDRADSVAALVGREFYGLCQIVSVKPVKNGKGFEVIAAECWDPLTLTRTAPITSRDGTERRRYATWIVNRDEALLLQPRQRFNIIGTFADLSVREGLGPKPRPQDRHLGFSRTVHQDFTVHLENVRR